MFTIYVLFLEIIPTWQRAVPLIIQPFLISIQSIKLKGRILTLFFAS